MRKEEAMDGVRFKRIVEQVRAIRRQLRAAGLNV
jgi:hypothetical protein